MPANLVELPTRFSGRERGAAQWREGGVDAFHPLLKPLCLGRLVSQLQRNPLSGRIHAATGADASIAGKQVFPPDNPWNTDISSQPVDPNSANLIASIGLSAGLHPDFGTVWDGAPNGIPYVVVAGTQPRVPVSFDYADESDPGPYPIPPAAPIEGGASSTGGK